MTPVVVVHGGAGDVPEEERQAHADGCARAAEAGLVVLRETGDPVAAAIEAVRWLESDPRYNAGTGACLTADGTVELDAAVMAGTDLGFGGVAGLPPFAHPIDVADAVRRSGRHVLYAGEGAARFAREQGFEAVAAEALVTDAARERLRLVLAGRADRGWAGGTVGAVARDAGGRLAAATSTGGMVAKRPGRVGDSPLPGAGTFADDHAGACSATGTGEQIMRFGLARMACDLLRAGLPAQRAAEAAIAGLEERVGGRGGLILIGARGEPGIARNTATMSFAVASADVTTVSGF